MTEERKTNQFALSERRLTVITFALFFAWLLAIPFEGRILYVLVESYHIPVQPFILGGIAAHCVGFILCGLFVQDMKRAKRLVLFSIVFCIAASAAFFFPPSFWWYTALFLSSFLTGCCMAAWGFFLKSGIQKSERVKTIADVIILSYTVTTLLGMAATGLSVNTALGLSMLLLGAAFLFARKLPDQMSIQSVSESAGKPVSIVKPVFLFCLFIMVISLNSGLMLRVLYPAYANHGWLTGWYWAVPYIIVVLIMRNIPRKANHVHFLYAAIAMMGFSFIAFIMLDHSAVSYLVVNTFMQGAFGIFNLFWWGIFSEMLPLHKNPARILGAGLFAGVLGMLIGTLIGGAGAFQITHSPNPALLALGVICATLVMLPSLHTHLATLLKAHATMAAFRQMLPAEQSRLIGDFELQNNLTGREREIASLLFMGRTYREIADGLCVSENTVRTHVKNIYSKHSVRNRAELMNAMMATQKSSSAARNTSQTKP